ncbi:MAG: glycosyltransferase family 4 protein [Chloroflexota bacterium]
MHIVFVNYHHLDSNSGIHIFNLANQLSKRGVTCTVCVPNHKERADVLGNRNFEVQTFEEAKRLMQTERADLIHAWTPRENVRKMVEVLASGYGAPYVVHLEDNEEAILESNLGMPLKTLLQLPEGRLNSLIPEHLSHPIRYRQFLKNAQGVTMVMDTLQAFGPENEAKVVIWPGYEEELQWHRPPDHVLRQRLGIAPQENVVVYTGNVHNANHREVFSLYLAVGLLNRRGVPTRLVRTGTDYVRLHDKHLKMLERYCISLGHLPRTDLPALLSIADALVQPGKADAFNMYRFPSKLPEYLASGKPVLLPAVNIGRFLKDEEEAILLKEGNALEIAQKLEALFPDRPRRERIGEGGRLFAEKNLKWSLGAEKLLAFYENLLRVRS